MHADFIELVYCKLCSDAAAARGGCKNALSFIFAADRLKFARICVFLKAVFIPNLFELQRALGRAGQKRISARFVIVQLKMPRGIVFGCGMRCQIHFLFF